MKTVLLLAQFLLPMQLFDIKTPDYHDLPREELMKSAEQALVTFGDVAEVYFKFTCEKCGERCTFEDANVLHQYGLCHRCGHRMEVKKGGFMLSITMKPKTNDKNTKTNKQRQRTTGKRAS